MDKMRALFEEQDVTDVAIPKVYDDLTSRRLLVSEWVDGIKLSDCEPGEIKELTKIGQEAFLVQLLQVTRPLTRPLSRTLTLTPTPTSTRTPHPHAAPLGGLLPQ